MQSNSPAWLAGNSFDLPDCIVTIDQAPEIMKFILGIGEETKTTKNKKGE
jgi:hypothetical protein